MSTLEREILEKFHQLDPDAQASVREKINEQPVSVFNWEAWFQRIESLYRENQAVEKAPLPPVDVVGLLREIRNGEDED